MRLRRFRRRRPLVAFVLLFSAVGVGLGWWQSSGSSGTQKFTAMPSSYVVVYHDVINGVSQWEVLAARRPFEGSDLTYRIADRPDSTSPADGGTIFTMTGLYTQDARGVRLVSGRQPGPPGSDLWLGVEMREALARGVAKDLHRSRLIAGVRCGVFRFADPPSGPLGPLNMTVGHDDLCLARDGLVLAEAWTYHGSLVQQRTAVTVVTDGGWPAVTPQPGATTTAAPATAAAAVVTADPRPASFLSAPTAPAGFQPVDSPMRFRLPDPQHPTQTVAASVVWAFARGDRVVTVEAGSEQGGVLPWATAETPTRPIHLRGLGPASTALRSDGPEVRIDLGRGRWVRVRGTVPLSTLASYADGLRPA